MKANVKAIWTVLAIIVALFILLKSDKEFILGLDLAGGSALTYKIETESLSKDVNINDSVSALRDVVERRVNLFGVREPSVITEYSRISDEHRLIVELPGITDLEAAKRLIGETPVLEFKTEKKNLATTTLTTLDFENTLLTGSNLKRSNLIFDQTTGRPLVELIFDDTGKDLFAKITKENLGKQVAIFLDGSPISAPVVEQEIREGRAVISGDFSVNDAKILVGRLNSGALPVPISLLGTSLVPPSLGKEAQSSGLTAALYGFLSVIVFMVVWYRLPGVVASFALFSYSVIMLLLFKFIPITLTSAGIAGFIISIGLAVDANILTFERMKEEIKNGKKLKDAVSVGFDRAWTSIRDSHIAAIIVSIILFWFGTSVVKGFAFAFFLGAVVSLLSAQIITKVFLQVVVRDNPGRIIKFFFNSGFSRK